MGAQHFTVLLKTWQVGLIIWVVLVSVATTCYLIGRKKTFDKCHDHTDLIPTSILGLLALLLGFTFSMVTDRFETRRKLLVEESNAIFGAYLANDLIAENKEDSKKLFLDYVKLRIDYYDSTWNSPESFKILNETDLLQRKMWNNLERVAKKNQSHLVGNAANTLDQMFNVSTMRSYSLRRNMPYSIYFVIVVIASFAIGCLTYDRGHHNESYHWRPILLITTFSLLISFVYDLDHPKKGIINITQTAMFELQKKLE